MKYYSSITKSLYDTEEACLKAEKEAKEAELKERAEKERVAAEEKAKKEERAAKRKVLAAEVEGKRKAMGNAQKEYRDAVEEFVNEFGSYHYSSNSVVDKYLLPSSGKIITIFLPKFSSLWA